MCNTQTCLWRCLQEHVASFKWLIPVKFCLWGLEKIKCLVLRPWKWVYNCLLRMKTFELLRRAQLSIVCVLSPVWLFRIPWTVAYWLFCPWNFQARILECFQLLPQGIYLMQGSNPPLQGLLHWQTYFLPLRHMASPVLALYLTDNSLETEVK